MTKTLPFPSPFSPPSSLYKGWLGMGSLLIFLMIILGGYTRLAGAGLSIVEWSPVQGILPPLGAEAWEEAFTLYKKTPESQWVQMDLDLRGFQSLFWIEYAHRLFGRLIGAWFLLPLLFFFWKSPPPGPSWERRWRGKSFLFSLLVGLQGALGWYMVKSGLIHEPAVSPYRLAAHLGMGVGIYLLVLGEFFTVGLVMKKLPEKPIFSLWKSRILPRLCLQLGCLFFTTLLLGALVAGHKAGHIYNTFPLMNGELLPSEAWFFHPWWQNCVANPVLVQFEHRLLAFLSVGSTIGCWLYGKIRFQSHALAPLAGAATVQGTLGVLTLLYQVPLALGVLHQGMALVLMTILLKTYHECSPYRGLKEKKAFRPD
jgi:cytochrome c oxidase assembly protein subunit 15